MPVVVDDRGIRYSIASAEEAMNWLMHERKQTSQKGRSAWEACQAARNGELAPEEARSAVEQVAKGTLH
nr:DUF982 domain-containing protein [Neorhizobium sp. T25_13]